jgi:Fic family protein
MQASRLPLSLIVSFDTIMKPPYDITPEILELLSQVSEKLGAVTAMHLEAPRAELRKENRIKTIQASLQIEGNTLTIDQVTAILENKKVLAPAKDIWEVQNAIRVYDDFAKWNASEQVSFMEAHAMLMDGLIPKPGKLRASSVGITRGVAITHIAPPAQRVKALLNDLFSYLRKDKDPLLIKSCVFHYELEFIHPFSDGNGRMGRLWQNVILAGQYPVFAYLPVESIIKKKQDGYYKALSDSDSAGNSTVFVEYMLGVMNEALDELVLTPRGSLSSEERIHLFIRKYKGDAFTRKEYLQVYKNISAPTASRDLKEGVERNLLEKEGNKNVTKYRIRK